MNHPLSHSFNAHHLDLRAFSLSRGEIAAHDSLLKYERLMQETQGLGGDLAVNWTATGEIRQGGPDQEQVWLHLVADARVPLICQRCLGPVESPLVVDQYFRFVADEQTAETQDEVSDEDVLVLSKEFNLMALVEDELLMALPLVPRHEACPTPVRLEAADADFEVAATEKINPFAVLAKLQSGKLS
jgi:uncharacterized protein